MLPQTVIDDIHTIMKRYPDKRSAVMGALMTVQRHNGGHLTKGDINAVAEMLEMGSVEVQAVAAFYSMYNVESAVGRYHIQVCRSLSCSILAAEEIIAHIERRLEVSVGQTTPDGKYSLTTVECLGSCGTAPMMQINDDYYEDLTPESVDRILESLN